MITVEKISKHYGNKRALSDVSCQIGAQTVVGLLGLNGAGKTTLLKIICGLLLPSAGRIRVGDADSLRDPEKLRRYLGFLPDRPPLYGEMSVRQMLSHVANLYSVPKKLIADRVEETLQRVHLQDKAEMLVENLSHGQRQRVGIAQAIVHDPAVVVLDEPISGLDPEQIVAMRSLIRSLADKHTVLLSSHILGEISQTCDRILLLSEGKLVADGAESVLTAKLSKVRICASVLLPESDQKHQSQAKALLAEIATQTQALDLASVEYTTRDAPQASASQPASQFGKAIMTAKWIPIENKGAQRLSSSLDIRRIFLQSYAQHPQMASLALCELTEEKSDLESLFLQLVQQRGAQ